MFAQFQSGAACQTPALGPPRANCNWVGVGAVVPAHLYAERLVAGPRLNLVQHGQLAGCGVRRGLHVRVGDADGALQRGELVEVRGK